ncbi:TrkA family potassium uptake protein (plasmid) [Tistrella bauzanensis]|uniref:TrkA family potassium uptake protein n=1 Tax=Tistrella arctica TaxID=3133430 RepID=A0ABU9YNG3_9PROT
MAAKKQFMVIGLGSFGATVAGELVRLGHAVLGIDTDRRPVDALADVLTHAVVADGTDEKVLQELGADSFDTCVVAIGGNIEASSLVTLHLKALGAKKVWAQAATAAHKTILTKIGADRVLIPEIEVGINIAQSLIYQGIMDYMALGDDSFVVEYRVAERFDTVAIEDLLGAHADAVRLLAVKRGRDFLDQPLAGLALVKGDRLVLLGPRAALEAVAAHL